MPGIFLRINRMIKENCKIKLQIMIKKYYKFIKKKINNKIK